MAHRRVPVIGWQRQEGPNLDEIPLGSRTLEPRRQLTADGERLPIGRRALDIISVLAEAGGKIVTKDELLEAVWPGVVVEENALQVHIVALRKALGPEADRLETIRGVGYRLDLNGAAESLDVPSAGGQDPTAVPAPAAGKFVPRSGIRGPWEFARRRRLGLAFATLLALLLGAWTMFGPDLGLRSQERIPVVVRALTATTGGDRTEAALASGITDELILRLRQVPELRIATAGPDGSVEGDAFRQAYIVDGNIRSSGDRLRVTARLIDAGGEVLWSDTFDRKLVDLFEVQEEIASAIGSTLSVSLDVGADATEYGGTDNPEAYAAYMQFFVHQLDFDQSVPLRYLERAVELDPNYVKALYGLSVVYGNQITQAPTPAEVSRLLAKSDDASARALAANPDIWIGHVARMGYEVSRKNLLAADRHRRRAMQLDKGNDPNLRTYLANYSMMVGRVEQAAAFRRSNEMIDPIYRNDPWKIWDFLMLGQYRASIDLYAKLERTGQAGLDGLSPIPFFAHLLLGSEPDAMKFAERQGLPYGEELLAFRADKALLTMSDDELKRSQEGRGQIPIITTALYAAYSGEPQLAVRLLRVAFERPGGGFVLFVLWHPAMAEARKTDEFEKLVMDLGFVKVWRESGDWGDFCRPMSKSEISCT